VQPALGSLQASVQTASGGGWLSAAFVDGAPGTLRVTASTANLAADMYSGSVSVTASGQESGLAIPVSLEVFDPPSSQTMLSATVSGASISVTSSDTPVYFTVEGASVQYGPVDGHLRTPATLRYSASPNLPPGAYYWNVIIHWAKGDLVIPVSATVPAAPAILPSVTFPYSVTLAPGEIMSIFGQNLATTTANLTLDASGNVAGRLNGTMALVGGTAAPLLYVSPTQVTFVTPYEIAGADSALVQVLTPFGATSPLAYRVGQSAPAIFTTGPSGYSQAAALNQDNSPNSLIDPAPRGSIIQIFATGEGQTSPPGVTGSITGDHPSTPVLPVSVTIGGVDATVQFAGSAPHSAAGLLQVNVVVPEGAPIGARVPIVLSIGGAQSQNGVFVAVR